MAWRVSVEIEEFSCQFQYGSDGPKMMGDIGVSDPRLSPDQVPSRVTIDGKISDCALFVLAYGGGKWIASQRFKNVVESLEADVHNWLPTELVWSSGEQLKENYYFLQHGKTLDTVIFERSFFKSGVSTTGENYVFFPVTNHLMTLDRGKVKGKHLWKEYYCGCKEFFFSNELKRLLESEGFFECFEFLECSEEARNDD